MQIHRNKKTNYPFKHVDTNNDDEQMCKVNQSQYITKHNFTKIYSQINLCSLLYMTKKPRLILVIPKYNRL